MADSEFEVFHRPIFETYPILSFKSSDKKNYPHDYYSLIPSDDYGDLPSSKSDTSDPEDGVSFDLKENENSISPPLPPQQEKAEEEEEEQRETTPTQCQYEDEVNSSKDTNVSFHSQLTHRLQENIENLPLETQQHQLQQRRRRKLPEIPKNKKSSILHLLGGNAIGGNFGKSGFEQQTSLPIMTPYMGGHEMHISELNSNIRNSQRHFLSLKCAYLLDEDSSPDSERFQNIGDVDSGHSTAHSPNDFNSMSPQVSSPISQALLQIPLGGVPREQLEMLEATHRGLHKFIPRHHDEIELEIGDGIYVQKEADDLWCEGVNLRTGRQGIFPSAYVVDLDYNEFDPAVQQVKKERYLLSYLGSVETLAHKGTGVVCQAVRKIVAEYGNSPMGETCILEVSDHGLRMVDRLGNNNKKEKKPCIDYFYSLKNVSFCAFHPRDHRFIGFITKHPTVQRFACHVFKGSESTRPVAEAVGRAFQRFYQKFIETAYPIEDIYLE